MKHAVACVNGTEVLRVLGCVVRGLVACVHRTKVLEICGCIARGLVACVHRPLLHWRERLHLDCATVGALKELGHGCSIGGVPETKGVFATESAL